MEYALAGYKKPIGVAEWQQQLTKVLPQELQASLPTIEDIEREMEEESRKIEESQGRYEVNEH